MTLSPSGLRDQLANGDIRRTATAAFAIVDALQKHPDLKPGEAIGALSAAFFLAMESMGFSPSDALVLVKNLMTDAHGRRAEFLAITDYLEKEILQ